MLRSYQLSRLKDYKWEVTISSWLYLNYSVSRALQTKLKVRRPGKRTFIGTPCRFVSARCWHSMHLFQSSRAGAVFFLFGSIFFRLHFQIRIVLFWPNFLAENRIFLTEHFFKYCIERNNFGGNKSIKFSRNYINPAYRGKMLLPCMGGGGILSHVLFCPGHW